MMSISLTPSKPGQICKIISDIPDLEEQDVFIVTENPADFDDEDKIFVVRLNDLQRNLNNPENAERVGVRKDQLIVISENLATYIESWNK